MFQSKTECFLNKTFYTMHSTSFSWTIFLGRYMFCLLLVLWTNVCQCSNASSIKLMRCSSSLKSLVRILPGRKMMTSVESCCSQHFHGQHVWLLRDFFTWGFILGWSHIQDTCTLTCHTTWNIQHTSPANMGRWLVIVGMKALNRYGSSGMCN